jgi:hypothetical protein
MDGQLKLRKEMAQKAVKMAFFGKAVEYDEAEACKETAAAIIAWEMEQEAATPPKSAYLYESVVANLQKELDEARSKLMHHSTARELELQEQVRELQQRCVKLEARAVWESHYAWTLPGAFLLAEDGGDCACKRERKLYGEFHSSAGAGGGAGETHAGSSGGRDRGSDVHLRACACGHGY